MNIFYFLLAHPFLGFLIASKGIIWIPVLIFSIIIRLFLWPLYHKASLNQRKLELLQPKINEIQKKYLKDPIKANLELKELFQQEKINPYITFPFIFLQIFLLIIFWNFFRLVILNKWTQYLLPTLKIYAQNFFTLHPINFYFFNIDLRIPHFYLTLFLAFLNFFFAIFQIQWQNKIYPQKPKGSKAVNQYTSAFLSFLILLFYQNIPAILIIYWLGFSLVGIIQEFLNYKNHFNSG